MKSRLNQQHGGTIIGLIIGLVIGLGVAVVVAIMITKTSTPFTNKLGMTKPPDLPAQITDPNKPLYGNAYKEPPLDRPVMEKPSQTASGSSDAAEASGVAMSADLPDVENLPETVTATPKQEKSVLAKNDTDDRVMIYLQVGAFRDPSDAENVRAKLALLDVESSVSAKGAEGDNLYRVRIGPFRSINEMSRLRSKLAENSIDVAVIKTPK